MAHEIENRNGQAAMAYAGDVPWHGLGKKVDWNLTPEEMVKAADLDWTVRQDPLYRRLPNPDYNPKQMSTNELMSAQEYIFDLTGQTALVREDDGKILDYVPQDWKPLQNETAFQFFADFVKEGSMKMDTAGSLKGGQVIWGLAKMQAGFSVCGDDEIEGYLLFSNGHRWGQGIDVRFTPIRVVCNNTLSYALQSEATKSKVFRQSHRTEFEPDVAKMALGVAQARLESYKEAAEKLTQVRFDEESIRAYMGELFPVYQVDKTKETKKPLSKNALAALECVETQPGANYAPGSWWQAFNAATYYIDHKIGKTADTRVHNAWFGTTAATKNKALKRAVELAVAA